VEIIELPNHPFFIATQFHPEFQSRPSTPHPLFQGFMQAALTNLSLSQAAAEEIGIALSSPIPALHAPIEVS
jgi:CTP synthase